MAQFIDRVTVVTASFLNDVYAVFQAVKNVIELSGRTFDNQDFTQSNAFQDLYQGSIFPGGRLSVSSTLAVPDTDVSGATIFYQPYRGSRVNLTDSGSRQINRTFVALSQTLADTTKSPAAATANNVYDMFLWDDSGTVRCTRGPAWSSATARNASCPLSMDSFGRLSNQLAITNGPAALRGLYVGSIATDGANVVNDSVLKRQVWNNYNRILRQTLRNEAAAASSWTYNTNAYRPANNSAANAVEILQGLAEDLVDVTVVGLCQSNQAASVASYVGIGVNSTTVNGSQVFTPGGATPAAVGPAATHTAYLWQVIQGRIVYTWLENGGGGAGVTTWFGTNVNAVSGISARLQC